MLRVASLLIFPFILLGQQQTDWVYQIKNRPWIDVRQSPYNAKCDGTTDDSIALQAAINAGISTNQGVRIPSGMCAFGTTLIMNSTTTAVHMEGTVGTGSGYSALKYTGNGTALSYNNGTGFIYNPYLKNMAVLLSGNAQFGIKAATLSQAYFEDFGILPTGSGTIQTGFYCNGGGVAFQGCNIGTFRHLTIEGTTGDAIELVNPSAMQFMYDDFFNIAGAAYHLAGSISAFDVTYGWHEEIGYALEVDDLLSTDYISMVGFHYHNNRDLFNASFATHTQALFTSSSGKSVTITDCLFEDNDSYFPSPNTASYPFQINWSATPGGGSYAYFKFNHNLIEGVNNTTAWVQVTNGNAFGTYLNFEDNFVFDQNFNRFYTQVSGSNVNYNDTYIFNGTRAFVKKQGTSVPFGTLFIQDNDAANTGITSFVVKAGPNQGTTQPFATFYDNSGNAYGFFSPSGLFFKPGYGLMFQDCLGCAQDWGLEMNGNNKQVAFDRYTPVGTYLDSPVGITKTDGILHAYNGFSAGLSAIQFTTTAATSDAMTITGLLTTSRCFLTAANASASTLTGVYVTPTANTLTVNHAATAGAVFNVFCSF